MINCAEDPRHALQLTRFHSWPRLRDQSNGEHSCQIMRILLTVWPDCPRRMLVHAVTHDAGEMAGDIQYPYKRKYPELKPLMDRIENDVREVMREKLGMPPVVQLSCYEQDVFKLVEFLELWEHGLFELGMGNSYARIIIQRGIVGASELMTRLEPGNAPDLRPAIKRYVDTRTAWETMK